MCARSKSITLLNYEKTHSLLNLWSCATHYDHDRTGSMDSKSPTLRGNFFILFLNHYSLPPFYASWKKGFATFPMGIKREQCVNKLW